jgi:4-diphosphocytidyl-2C-methyl-D-erythritol kinase
VVLDPEALQTWGGLARLGGNDFESVVWEREPRVREVFERVADTKPLLARLSGSGSAIVGIYRSERELEHAAMIIGTERQRVVRTQTRSRPAPRPVAMTTTDP